MSLDQISLRVVSKSRTGPLFGSLQWPRSSSLVYYQVRFHLMPSYVFWECEASRWWFDCDLSLFSSVYAGHHSILIDPAEVELNPSVWMNTISHYKSKSDAGWTWSKWMKTSIVPFQFVILFVPTRWWNCVQKGWAHPLRTWKWVTLFLEMKAFEFSVLSHLESRPVVIVCSNMCCGGWRTASFTVIELLHQTISNIGP